MEIRRTTEAEVAALTAISKAAFDTDIEFGNTGAGGPPGYDSEGWHRKMLAGGALYTLLEAGEMIGGMLVFRDKREPNVMYMGRIFIAPQRHRTGLGEEAMRIAEEMLPGIDTWRLDTPIWNARTNRFYPKLGYRETSRDAEFIYYQKTIQKEG